MDQPNVLNPCATGYSLRKDLRLNGWFLVAAVCYLAAVFLCKHHPDWPPVARAGLSLLPVAPGLLYVRAWLRFIRGMDELQRRIQMEAWLFAALSSLVVIVSLRTLLDNGIALGWFEHGPSVIGAATLMFGFWLPGTAIANCRYR